MAEDDERFTTDEEFRALAESIKVKRSFVLDTQKLVATEGDIFERERDWMQFGGLPWVIGSPIPGNLNSGFFWDDDTPLEEKLRSQLKLSTASAGAIATTVELEYYAVTPETPEEAEVLFQETAIGTHLTLDEFVEDMENGASWIYDVFATATIYDLFFAVAESGFDPNFQEMEPPINLKPIEFEEAGRKLELYVLELQD